MMTEPHISINRPAGESTYIKYKVRDTLPCEERLRDLKDCKKCWAQFKIDHPDEMQPCDCLTVCLYTFKEDGKDVGYRVHTWAKLLGDDYCHITLYQRLGDETLDIPDLLMPIDWEGQDS